jgi:hypothetical protein
MERQGPTFGPRTTIRGLLKDCKGDIVLSTPLGNCEPDKTSTSNQDVQRWPAAAR